MVRMRPDWMPTEGPCILFVDELPQAQAANMNIAAQLFNERRIGPHYTATIECVLVAAGQHIKSCWDQQHAIPPFQDRADVLGDRSGS